MPELYTFVFCLALGIIARLLYLGETALVRRTDFLPLTVAADIMLVMLVAAAFVAYVILLDVIIAPYMFAAVGCGYLLTVLLTRRSRATKNH